MPFFEKKNYKHNVPRAKGVHVSYLDTIQVLQALDRQELLWILIRFKYLLIPFIALQDQRITFYIPIYHIYLLDNNLWAFEIFFNMLVPVVL